MDAVTANIAKAFPKSNKGWGALVEPLKNDFLPKERIQTLWMLLGAVGFVLLIACVNVANLLLAKGTARQKEMAIRTSLGASRSSIFAQFLTENLLLACLGGFLAWASVPRSCTGSLHPCRGAHFLRKPISAQSADSVVHICRRYPGRSAVRLRPGLVCDSRRSG